MEKYECKICGYVYDPELGDEEADIVPGTAWEKLPDNWECPLCGAKKIDFVPIITQ